MINIRETAIIPYNKTSNVIHIKDKYHLYAPIAGFNNVGLAAFTSRDFNIKNNGTVELKVNLVDFYDTCNTTFAEQNQRLISVETHANAKNNPHEVTKGQVGLNNVDNVRQIPLSYIDHDPFLGGENPSPDKIPSQLAIATRVNSIVSNVQADWNENNSLEPAYIKNKPQYDAIPTADSGNLVKSGGIKAGTLADIASHNVNEDAHEAIRDTVAMVKKIAEGSHVAIAFDDEAQLTAWINGEFTREDGKVVGDLIFGQNIYLRALNEPDYWVSKLPVFSISDLTKLPTEKIDLSDYNEAIKVIWGLA